MRRYRRGDEVWELSLEGCAVRIRAGDGAEDTQRFRSELRAHWEIDRLGAEREAAGFELIARTDAVPALSDAEFEAALRREPDAVDGYLVYSDWLGSQGDPRGELIAIQAQLLGEPPNSPRRGALERQETLLLARHRRRLWGSLGERVVDADMQLYAADLFRTDWHLGFMRAATLDLRDLSFPPDGFAALTREYLGLPTAALLRELRVIRSSWELDGEAIAREPALLRAILETVAGHAPDTLRALTVGDPDEWNYIEALALPPGPGLAGLERLELCARELAPPSDLPPSLTDLSLIADRVPPDLIAAVAAAPLPELRSLAIRIHRSQLRDDRARFAAAPLERLLRATPGLRALTLHGTGDTDDVCRLLVAAPCSAQLTHLDLDHGVMTGAGAGHLAAAGFERLSTLVVSNNRLDEDDRARLDGVARRIVARPQAAPGDA